MPCWGQRLASQLSNQWAPGLERSPTSKNKMAIHQRLLHQQLPFACSSSARGRTLYPSGPCWGFMWLKLGLVHVVSMAVTSYVQLPCCAPRTLCPCIHLLPLALRFFLSPLPQWPLSLGRKAIHPRVLRWRKLVSISRGRKNKGHKVLLVKWVWEEIG